MGSKGEPDTKMNWSTGCRSQDGLQLQLHAVKDVLLAEQMKDGRLEAAEMLYAAGYTL
jgi:hypothetical protein